MTSTPRKPIGNGARRLISPAMGEPLPPPAVPAGWYPRPDGTTRYFDGTQWTDRAPRRISRNVLIWLIVAYTLAMLGLIFAWWPYGWWPL